MRRRKPRPNVHLDAWDLEALQALIYDYLGEQPAVDTPNGPVAARPLTIHRDWLRATLRALEAAS